jgi:hypothetical protein
MMMTMLISSAAASQASVSLDFDSASAALDFLGGGSLSGGGSFNFSSGTDFTITSGSSSGDVGSISGTYQIGSVSVFGPAEVAEVTGTGTLTVGPVGGPDLYATISWNGIETFGADGGLNYSAGINLTGISYSGTDPNLTPFTDSGSGVLSITWTTLSSLSTLSADGGATDFSGEMTATPPQIVIIPEPATMFPGLLLLLPLGAKVLRMPRRWVQAAPPYPSFA